MSDPTSINWDFVNWQASDNEIARVLNFHPSYIRAMRETLKKPGYLRVTCESRTTKKTNEELIASADWSKTNRMVADELGITISYAAQLRKKIFTSDDPRYKILDRSKYESLDWSKQDTVLCKEVGVTRERIRQMRKSFDKAPAEHHGAHTVLTPTKVVRNYRIQKLKADAARYETMTTREIAKEFGITHESTRKILFAAEVTPSNGRMKPWKYHEIIDWRLPNKTLAEIWNENIWALGSHRIRNLNPKATWRRFHDAVNPHGSEAEYTAALEAQIELAKSKGLNPIRHEIKAFVPDMSRPSRNPSKIQHANFDLPDFALAEIYGLANNGTVSNYRHQHNKQHAKWRKSTLNAEYEVAYAAEVEKLTPTPNQK